MTYPIRQPALKPAIEVDGQLPGNVLCFATDPGGVAVAGSFDREIPPKTLLRWLEKHNGASTNEVKTQFGSNSRQARRSLGILMAQNKILGMGGFGKGVYWLLVTGERGYPQLSKARSTWADDRPATGKKLKALQAEKPRKAKQTPVSVNSVDNDFLDDDEKALLKSAQSHTGTTTTVDDKGHIKVNIGSNPDEE